MLRAFRQAEHAVDHGHETSTFLPYLLFLSYANERAGSLIVKGSRWSPNTNKSRRPLAGKFPLAAAGFAFDDLLLDLVPPAGIQAVGVADWTALVARDRKRKSYRSRVKKTRR